MIYLVEDDESIRELVVYTLKSQGMDAKGFERPSLFWKELEKEVPALILLDIMLPGLNGLEVLRRLLQDHPTPVILLTARDAVMDKVAGLDAGAVDYITKPFAIEELLARIRVAIKLHRNFNKGTVRVKPPHSLPRCLHGCQQTLPHCYTGSSLLWQKRCTATGCYSPYGNRSEYESYHRRLPDHP